MKLIACLLIVAAVLETGCTPSSVTRPIAIEAVTSLGQDQLVAVGSSGSGSRGGLPSSGVVARSDDRGRHWAISYPNLEDLTSVAVAGTRIVAARYCLPPSAGDQALGPTPSSCLFASDDGGSTWVDLAAGRLIDPTFVDASYGWAHSQIPAGTELAETLDGGQTWSALDSGCPPDRQRIYRAVATGRRTGYLICFAIPTETGQPWSLVRLAEDGQTAVVLEGNSSYGEAHNGIADEYLRGFSMRSDGLGYIWTSHLYRTTDAGQSWETVPLPSDGLSDGEFWGNGVVIDGNLAYLVRRGSTSSIVEYDAGTFMTLVEWPLPAN